VLNNLNRPSVDPGPGGEVNPGIKNPITGNYLVDYNLSNEDLIGIAAFRVFEEQKELSVNPLVFKDKYKARKIENEYHKIDYDFEYIKIENAIKFDFEIKSNIDELAYQMLDAECGTGEVEVVIADFTTYSYIDGYNIPHRDIVDRLISIRGREGYFTIITNSGTRTETGWTDFFSSHKKLTSNSVEKDFTPPILTIYVEEIGEDLKIAFKASQDILSKNDFNDINKELVSGPFEEGAADEMYAALDLAKVPVKNIICQVERIDEVLNGTTKYYYLLVSNVVYDVKNIYIVDETVCDFKSEIEIGDQINVYFNFYYLSYNPGSIVALKVERVENNE
ncbi:MAG: hypothetical protein IJO27_05200, partial [Bacilli bacterium]|nr:hypothetical protein [Bacilli bacterium]